MSESAHLLFAEYDAIDPWWFPNRHSAGTATLVQQFSEQIENLLRRILKRAQDLRKSGYVLDATYFVLGRSDGVDLDSRAAIARCLQSILEPQTGVLHLVAPAKSGHLVPFVLADHLRGTKSPYRLEMHFPESASWDAPALSQHTPSKAPMRRLLDVA